jgi:putative membrane protein
MKKKTSDSSSAQKSEAGTSDVSTLLANKRTDMAIDRTLWAAQRTLMGWIRTALSMISFGFTIGKLGQTIQDIEVTGLRHTRMIGIDTIAYFLVIIGTLALSGAAFQYRIRVHKLHEQGLPIHLSIEFIVAVVLSVMGIVAFGALVMKL